MSEGEESYETVDEYDFNVGWDDLTPVAQDDGPNPVVAIAYSEECKNFFV